MVFREQPGQSVFPRSSESVSVITELNNSVSVINWSSDQMIPFVNQRVNLFLIFQFKSLKKLKRSVAFTKLL